MLNHRNTGIAFLAFLAILFYGITNANWPLWPVWALFLIFIFILFLGTVRIGMRFFLPSINNGNEKLPHVALTFDDGPDSATLDVAACLERHGVRGTFFLIGHKIEINPQIVNTLHQSGHLVGSHSYFHKWFLPLRFPAVQISEILRTNAIIESIINKKPRWYRPPFGITNPWVAKAVKHTDMVSIGWSVRSFDTVIGAGDLLSKRLKSRVKNGSVILLHDGGTGLVGFLDTFIPWLKQSGYQIVSLEDLINEKAYR
jgi:peptidoglycan-N-acetylglucosamine deacetylase